VGVPEAAVDEDHVLARSEDDVGIAGKIGPMKTVAKTIVEETLSYSQLRLGVLFSDPGHDLASGFLEDVWHSC